MFDRSTLPTAAEVAKSMLTGRAVGVRCLQEARSAGNKKEIRAWESQLRKVDALVAKYGMQRYAQRP
jgi:hypothetical protein